MKSLLLLLTISACSDLPNDAPEKCRAFIATACNHSAKCFQEDFNECYRASDLAIDCVNAVEVSKQYDLCLKAIEQSQCTTAEIPLSCVDVIKVSF